MSKCYLVPCHDTINNTYFYIWEDGNEKQLNDEYSNKAEALQNIPEGYKTDNYNMETTN